MKLTEAQLEEARQELARREADRHKSWQMESARRQREADDKFWAGMCERYPHLDRDTMYAIWSEVDDYYR